MSSTILSTKVLTPSQKALALNAGLGLVEYNAISIKYLRFQLPNVGANALIFSSQNGVKAYLEHIGHRSLQEKKRLKLQSFCVGEKTEQLLEQNGFRVKVSASNASALGTIITENYPNLHFLWPTGNQRRDELPQMLEQKKIAFNELTVYQTIANTKKMDAYFDGILFFSPSAVRSFVEKNSISGVAFCIGNTTAQEIKKYTDNYIIATKPTIENVLVQAVKRLIHQ